MSVRYFFFLIASIEIVPVASGQIPDQQKIDRASIETQLNKAMDMHRMQPNGITCLVRGEFIWGDDAGRFQYLVKSLGDRVLKQIEEQDGTDVVATNGDYFFRLFMPRNGTGAKVTELIFREEDKYVKRRRQSLHVEIDPLTYGFGIKTFEIQRAIADGLMQINSVKRLGSDTMSDIELSLSRTDKDPDRFWRFNSGSVVVSPTNKWRITSENLVLRNGSGSTGQSVGKRTYGRAGPHRTLGITDYVWEERWTHFGTGEMMFVRYHLTFDYLDETPTPKDFTLSAFGLAEPVDGHATDSDQP